MNKPRPKSDMWETPLALANKLADVAFPYIRDHSHEGPSRVLDIGAGRGFLTRAVLNRVAASGDKILDNVRYIAVEPDYVRVAEGSLHCRGVIWKRREFKHEPADVYISNFPFSKAIDLLTIAADGCTEFGEVIVCILPSDYFQSKTRGRWLRNSNLRAIRKVEICGRVGYLAPDETGKVVAHKNRQIYDAIWVFAREYAGYPDGCVLESWEYKKEYHDLTYPN